MAIVNRRARYDYHILETFEAGIMLHGPEVKSLRAGQANLTDSHCFIRNMRVLMVGCHISPYKPASRENADPARTRELLLRKKEIVRLVGKLKEKGLSLVPMKIYFNDRGFAKIELALVRGKKEYDKRETIKEREVKRELARNYKLR